MANFAMVLISTITALAFTSSCSETSYPDSGSTEKLAISGTEIVGSTIIDKPKTDHPLANTNALPSTAYDLRAYDAAIQSLATSFWWLFSTEELLNMGSLVCEELDSGESLESARNKLIDAKINSSVTYVAEGVAVMAVSAIIFLCPEHQWRLIIPT